MPGFHVCNRVDDNCPSDCPCATEHVPVEVSPEGVLCSETWSTCMRRGTNGAIKNQYCTCTIGEVGI